MDEHTPPTITLRPIDGAAAESVSRYRYAPPYDVYNVPPENVADNVRYLLDPANQVYAVYRGDALLGFCSFGGDARVPGGDYSAPALDLGIGLDPALTGQGLGGPVTAAMFALAQALFAPHAFRTTVAAFNQRSRRLCRRLGFREVQRFRREPDGAEFVIMVRPAGGPPAEQMEA